MTELDASAPKPEDGSGDHARPPLTRAQRWLIGLVALFATAIAGIGFAGSYVAVTRLAHAKGFGGFAEVFPAGIDSGIAAFLALDLVLTWLRMPYPLVRQAAWFLTACTITFNASASWGDWVAVGMHAALPSIFVVVVEAARHAVGRLAEITAGRYIEWPPLVRWFIDPLGTFVVWRRMRLWHLASYRQVIAHQREVASFRSELRSKYGFWYRSHLAAIERLALRQARFGTSVSETLARPETEARAEAEARRAEEVEARRQAEVEAEAARETEARRRAEAETEALRRAETEAQLAEAEGKRLAAEAEAQARLADIQRRQRIADAQAEAEAARIREQQEAAEGQRRAQELREKTEAERELLRIAEQRAQAEAEAARKAKERAEAEALRKRLAAEVAAPKPNPEAEARPASPNPKPKDPKPADVGGKRAQVETEVTAVLGWMASEGPGAATLKRIMSTFGLPQTTAYDRLAKAKARYEESA